MVLFAILRNLPKRRNECNVSENINWTRC